MKPRHRRILIPGLLVALLVVVVVAALTDRAEAASGRPEVVLSDPRITESSGLAVSRRHAGIAYTVNDSGHPAEIYAVDLGSGDVVGVTSVRAPFRDVEALALRDGTLWIADLGDNLARRDDAVLFAIDEPGRESGSVDPRRYPVELEGGPADVEALLAEPGTDELLIVTKSLTGADVMSVSQAALEAGGTPTFVRVARDLPALVTDGAFSPDGSRVALLSYGVLWTVDPGDWSVIGSQPVPSMAQSETLTFVDRDTVLIGSEGADSPLHRLTLAPRTRSASGLATVATTRPSAAVVVESARATGDSIEAPGAMVLGGAGVAAVAALVAFAVWRSRSRGAR